MFRHKGLDALTIHTLPLSQNRELVFIHKLLHYTVHCRSLESLKYLVVSGDHSRISLGTTTFMIKFINNPF